MRIQDVREGNYLQVFKLKTVRNVSDYLIRKNLPFGKFFSIDLKNAKFLVCSVQIQRPNTEVNKYKLIRKAV